MLCSSLQTTFTYLFTLELPSMNETNTPSFLTGQSDCNGKVCLTQAQISVLREVWTEEWYSEIISGCCGRPSIKIHISNPLTGATMTLSVEDPGYESCSFGGVSGESTYNHIAGSINDSRIFDIVDECLSTGAITRYPESYVNQNGRKIEYTSIYFQSDTGLCFTLGSEESNKQDLSLLMINHPLAQIICKSSGGQSKDMRNKLNIAAPLDTRDGDHGMLLSGYLDFSNPSDAHFKINLTQHFSNSWDEGQVCWGAYDKLNGEVLATLINCVSEMHID